MSSGRAGEGGANGIGGGVGAGGIGGGIAIAASSAAGGAASSGGVAGWKGQAQTLKDRIQAEQKVVDQQMREREVAVQETRERREGRKEQREQAAYEAGQDGGAGERRMSEADVTEAMRQTGKSRAEVIRAAQAKGFQTPDQAVDAPPETGQVRHHQGAAGQHAQRFRGPPEGTRYQGQRSGEGGHDHRDAPRQITGRAVDPLPLHLADPRPGALPTETG